MTYLNKRLMVQTSGIRKDVENSSWMDGFYLVTDAGFLTSIEWSRARMHKFIYINTIPDAPWDWNTYQHLTKNFKPNCRLLFQPHGVKQLPKTLQTMGNVSVNRWDVNHYVERSRLHMLQWKKFWDIGTSSTELKGKGSRKKNTPENPTYHLKGILAKWKSTCLPSRHFFRGKLKKCSGVKATGQDLGNLF